MAGHGALAEHAGIAGFNKIFSVVCRFLQSLQPVQYLHFAPARVGNLSFSPVVRWFLVFAGFISRRVSSLGTCCFTCAGSRAVHQVPGEHFEFFFFRALNLQMELISLTC